MTRLSKLLESGMAQRREIDGDSAKQTATLILSKRVPDKSSFTVLTAGRYTDTLAKTADGWRFTRRRIELDIDISHIVAAFSPPAAVPASLAAV